MVMQPSVALALGEDGAVGADDEAGGILHLAARRRTVGRSAASGKRIERARHRHRHRDHGALGGLVVQHGEHAHLGVADLAADVELLQALKARQHEEVRPHHAVFGLARVALLLGLGDARGGGARLPAVRELDLDRAGRRRPCRAAGVAVHRRHQLGRRAEAGAAGRIADDLPADMVLQLLRGVRQRAALLRVEHAGRLGAVILLERLDGGDHALAHLAVDRAVVVRGPGEVGLDRQPLGRGHRPGGVGRRLHAGRAGRRAAAFGFAAAGARLRERGAEQPAIVSLWRTAIS